MPLAASRGWSLPLSNFACHGILQKLHIVVRPNVKVFIRTISSCAIATRMYLHDVSLKKKIEWIIHSIYRVKRFNSILTPVEWKFTTQRVKSRPVHSIFTPKEVITDVTTQRVKIKWTEWFFFLESIGLELGLRWGFGCGSCLWSYGKS